MVLDCTESEHWATTARPCRCYQQRAAAAERSVIRGQKLNQLSPCCPYLRSPLITHNVTINTDSDGPARRAVLALHYLEVRDPNYGNR
ncbi:hypothetical protein J6590_033700 [Homalodisca vitripennis]|nr:hypothetical protein J6590_033700 [Homalodisca vitripennis]